MKVNFYPPSVQASGNFNFGEILEKKPIGFPQDGGLLKPFSNLFYWAHAWTPGKRSTIGLHPHQGFEICSFVLKGNINHFDTKQNKWIPLSEGDVQIIRSGNGISHAEEIDDNSEIFLQRFNCLITLEPLKKSPTGHINSSSMMLYRLCIFKNHLPFVIDRIPCKFFSIYESIFFNFSIFIL